MDSKSCPSAERFTKRSPRKAGVIVGSSIYRFITTNGVAIEGSVDLLDGDRRPIAGIAGLNHLRQAASKMPDRFTIRVKRRDGTTADVRLGGADVQLVEDVGETERTPIGKIHASIERIKARGHKIRIGDHGVEHGRLSGDWYVTEGAPALSPVGAVCLDRQPDALAYDEPETAAAAALGASFTWLEGFQDGLAAEPSGHRLHSLGRTEYLAGCDAGYHVRHSLLAYCVCGAIHPEDETCPSCEETGIAEREARVQQV